MPLCKTVSAEVRVACFVGRSLGIVELNQTHTYVWSLHPTDQPARLGFACPEDTSAHAHVEHTDPRTSWSTLPDEHCGIRRLHAGSKVEGNTELRETARWSEDAAKMHRVRHLNSFTLVVSENFRPLHAAAASSLLAPMSKPQQNFTASLRDRPAHGPVWYTAGIPEPSEHAQLPGTSRHGASG